ncbi:MAG: sulfatase-like hydrolase/transferase [Candidatus Aminicenantes bacterium]|nr:sulfatase-like hydrolase/transferase [Candidatus Aminicenantes bacterium]NIM80525.1 sulfatase-like hydrolase/transferase [Candidatus Aminicenantes bacterium]NIN19881.1 sulfatase-like hydrolase/transferase [Candidatus Aminicenantes bacterium]NIN43757.1 sulfatase-like hydrolase/transferase [Candidatus Aminicenantes bacterium]NIN86507.1 sulfatase-like hydrolase/transferase [Candidatus Aminicenantes bacterium]
MFYKTIFSILLLVLVLISSSCGGGKEVKPNILLITIDTLRSDHLGVYGYPRETSPFIDHLAKNGLMFKHVITPQPMTSGSHASILTSLHPLTHNVITNGFVLNEKVQTIAEVLKNNGYYTIGTIAVGFLTGKKNFSQGFDSFSDKWERDPQLDPKFPIYERAAPSVNQSLFKQINEYYTHHKHKPVFIWVHYYDPHGPYYDKDYITFKNKPPKGKPKAINQYDKEIRYTDDSIRELYRYLEEKGLARRLITCVTADHGEQFGEHGYTFGHPDFYSENIFVPLIVHGYGIARNKTVETYVSTLDISVTLLGRAGLAFTYPTEGIDLLKKSGKPQKIKNRKFLIISNKDHARSLQLMGDPFAYILNFDYHYKYWYFARQNTADIPPNRFKSIQDHQVNKKGNKWIFPLSHGIQKGRKYAVLRLDIKKNNGLSVKIQVPPILFTSEETVPADVEHLDIIYPITVLDRIKVHLYLNQETVINNLEYAVILKKEFPKKAVTREIKNEIYQKLLTLRKKKSKDEFFNLSNDIRMEKNLVDVKTHKPFILEYRKLIYSAYKYYLRKKSWLLKGAKDQDKLTAKDKEMLKSLGYL